MRARHGRRSLGLAVLAALLLALPLACRAAPPQPVAVSFPTADGFTLHADFVKAARPDAPVAILLHMYRSSRSAWAPLVPRLAEAGFSVLALDQRAHGQSTRRGSEEVRVEALSRQEFAELVRQGPEDVRAARRFLASQGIQVERIGLVGASYGCTVALLASESVEGIVALVLLSPGIAYFGVDVREAARRFPGPLLAVAAEDDPRAVESARALVQVHAGKGALEIYPSGGHGTQLFGPRPELLDRILEFLAGAATEG